MKLIQKKVKIIYIQRQYLLLSSVDVKDIHKKTERQVLL